MRNDRALIGFFVQRIAHFQLRSCCDELPNEFVVSRSLDKNARTTQANLTLVGERGSHAAGDRSVKIGVGENDVGIFAAEFERDFFEQRRAGFSDFAAGHCAARKGDRADFWMRSDRGADIWSRAVHNVEHARRQTGFATNFAKQIRRHRRELAWFCDGGITDGERGRNFPAQQIERQIPRRNQADDSARLAQRVVERDAVRDVRFVFRVQNRGREKAKIGNRRAESRAFVRAKSVCRYRPIRRARILPRSRSIKSAMRRRIRERCSVGVRDQSPNAFSAAATASSTSRKSLSATCE